MGGRGSYSATRRGTGDVRTMSGGKGQRRARPMDVSKFQGMTLQQIEDRIRNLSHEELFVIDKDGTVLSAYKGNSNSVAFLHSELLRDGVTVTHGHPKGAEGYGATFSTQDVLNMAASNWAEHRAAASGRNELNYIIRRNSENTSQKSKELYDRIKNDEPVLKAEMKIEANKAGRTNLSVSRKRQIYTGVLDRYYSEVLPKYGFDYITRKEGYNYNR